MNILSFFKKLMTLQSSSEEQAVIVYLENQNPPDVAALEDQLEAAIIAKNLGEFDGNEWGPSDVILFMYGPSADKLFQGIEPILRNSKICKGSRVEIRSGGPDTAAREVILPL